MTATWSFQNPSNYTYQNLSVSPGEVTLENETITFIDTTMQDFQDGTAFFNVNVTSNPGSVVLDNTSLASLPETLEIGVDEGSGRDSTLYEIMPNMNYGGSEFLDARLTDQVRILVQFDLSGVYNPEWIIGSELLLKMTQAFSSNAVNVSVNQLNASWTEGTGTGQPTGDGVTWDLRDGTNPWGQVGGDFNPLPEDIVTDIRDVLTWYSWNITDLVVDWANGTKPNYGVILVPVSAEDPLERKRFHGKEYAVAVDRPKLVINYSSASPALANGTFVSRTFDAQTTVNWGDISWISQIPNQTNLSIRTRSGDCLGSWSDWSQTYSLPAGSRIASPSNRCLQYKAEMVTYNNTRTPMLEEVVIELSDYFLDTTMEDFLGGEGLFNVDVTSIPGSVILNDTSLASPPKIFEVRIDNGTGRDATIDESFPKKNYGASATLDLDIAAETRFLVMFDLTGVPNPQQVNRSEIWLRTSALTGRIQSNISVHEVYNDWIEGTGMGNPSHDGVTWESRGDVNPWLNPGGDFNATPEYILSNVTDDAAWWKWDVTRLAGEWLNGTTPNYGALFKIHFGGWVADLKAFFSKQYGGPAERPKLVLYYDSGGPGIANGTFISRTMDAQSPSRWGNISWNSTIPPQTDMSIRTRSGDCLGAWSAWSQAYATPSGSQILSPPNRCIQYKAELLTYVVGTTPILEDVRIEYWKYVPQGRIETEDFAPSNLVGWENFNASLNSPLGTNITFWYSVNSGMVWAEIFKGESLQMLLSPKIMFAATLTTTNGGLTPTLFEMNVTYRVPTGLDHIHMSLDNWTGTTDEWVDIDAVGHDAIDQVVSFTQKWATDDPWGSVDANGLYYPGMVGTWKVYCNNTTDTISNYTVVDILPGATFRLAIDPWDPGTLTTDDSLSLNVTAYDSKGNSLGPVLANWSVTGGIGSITPGPSSSAVFDPTTPGFGTVVADDGIGHTNTTNIIQVIAGTRASIGIEPWSPGTLAVNDVVNFTAFFYDADDNQVGSAIVNWTVIGGIGNINPGPSNNSTFTATTVGNGVVEIDDGIGHTNTTDIIQVIGSPPSSVGIEPWSPGTLTTDDTVLFTAYAYDIAGSQIGKINVTWTVNGGIGTMPSGPSESSLFDATTVGVGTVSIDDGMGHTNTTDLITIIPGLRNRIGIEPWSPGTLSVNQSVNLTAYAYDSDGNQIGTAIVNWTVNGGIGTVFPGPSDTSTFNATTPGVGTVTVDDGLGHTNTTDFITVVPGAIFRVGIEPWSPGMLTTDQTLLFTAYAYDVGGNQIGMVNVSWTVNGGIGTIPPGPSDTSLFDATTVGFGTVSIDDGLGHTNTTDIITVVAGARSRVGIEPWSPGTITADDNVNFAANAYDADENLIGAASVMWTVNGGIGTVFPGPSETSVFVATTVGIGTVSIDDGMGHTNTTDLITVVAGNLDRIVLQPASVTLNTSESQEFTATGYDSDSNVVPLINPVWETNAGNIIWSSADNATLNAQGSPISNGWIRITAVFQNNVSANSSVEVVEIDVLPEIGGVIPNQVKEEDHGSWVLDLRTNASDPQDDFTKLSWYFVGVNESVVQVSGENVTGNHFIVFTTVSNAFGNTLASIWLKDSDGNLDSQPIWINITPVNDRPIIQSITPFSVHYDVPYSYYFYDYVSDVETPKEDLTLSCDDMVNTTVDGLRITFTYPEESLGQTFYPQVTVTDEEGATASTVVAITVTDDNVPVLQVELPDVTMYEDEVLIDYFDLDDYFSDPDADSLYYTHGNTNVNITIDQDDHTVDFRAETDWHGMEIVTFRAIDPQNARAEDIVLITVLPINDPPQISGVPDLVVHYDTPAYPDYNYTFDLHPYVSDVDNLTEELVMTTNFPLYIMFYAPDNLVMSIHFPQSMNGSILNVVLTVSDGLSTDTDTIRISITEDWPPEVVAHPPDVIFDEDTVLEDAFNIYASFWDRDGDVLIYTYGNENVYVDINNATGFVTFSAVKDWYGFEMVSFRATDPFGALSECWITVTVRPVNDEPVILPIPNQVIDEGRSLTLDLRPYIYDVDNDFSELNITLTGAYPDYATYAGGFVVFAYEPGIRSDHVLVTVSDGEKSNQTYIEVQIVPADPFTQPDAFVWFWLPVIAILASAIIIALTRKYLVKMRIEEAYVIHESGKLVKHVSRYESLKVDEDIFSGMLTVVREYANQSAGASEDRRLRTLDFGKKKMLITGGEFVYLVVLYKGAETDKTINLLNEVLGRIEKRYGEELSGWSGRSDTVEGIEEELGKIFGKGDSVSMMGLKNSE
jgi:hypothetical protein